MPNKNIFSVLMLIYITSYVSANWFDAKLIKIIELVTDGGTLIFPITYLLSSLITEVYGYKYSRLAIWLGFIFNIALMLYGLLITYMPYPASLAFNAKAFDQIQLVNTRIIIASVICYLIVEPLNSFITAKFKILLQGKLASIRFAMTAIITNFIGTSSFSILGFYGIIPDKKIVHFMLSSYLIMGSIEIIVVPISAKLSRNLKEKEKLDIYDYKTNFNIFSLDVKYNIDANKFRNEN